MKFILLETITEEKVAINPNEIISVSENKKKKRIDLVTKTETWYISLRHKITDIIKSIEESTI